MLFFATDNCLSAQNPANSANPYDYAGEIHNEALDYFFENSEDLTNATAAEIRTLMQAFMDSKNYEVNVSSYFSSEEIKSKLTDFFSSESKSDYLLQNGVINNSVKTYMDNIDNALQSSANQTAFYNSMITIENSILNDGELSESHKQILLSSASVIRFSTNYWSDGNGSQVQALRIRWKNVGDADYSGAWGGFLGGMIIGGSISFGTLSVPTAVVTTITGAAMNSAANIGAQALHWWLNY